MSEGIKRMLAERAANEAEREKARRGEKRWQRLVDATLAGLERAAPFMDENWTGKGWKPSEKLKILYFACATSPRPQAAKEALLFVQDMIERARRLWIEGLSPDPWQPEPKVPLVLRTYEAESARQNGEG